jgi:hypothetical protein
LRIHSDGRQFVLSVTLTCLLSPYILSPSQSATSFPQILCSLTA